MPKTRKPEPVETDPAKLSHRYSRLAKDMERVLQYLEGIKRLRTSNGLSIDDEGYMAEGLKTAAVVTYSRCFLASETKGKAAARADFKTLRCSEDQTLQAMHDHILTLRNKAIAHADWMFHHTELVPVEHLGITVRVSSMLSGVEAIHEYTFEILARRVFEDAELLERRYAETAFPSAYPRKPA